MTIKRLKIPLKSIKVVCKSVAIFVILFSCLYSSFNTGYYSFVSFYSTKPNPKVVKSLYAINEIPGYNILLEYTGLDTGYGFFSPNVSSDFIVTHNVYSKLNAKRLMSNSLFHSKEGALRFTNINSLFMEKVEALEDSTQIDSLRMKFLGMILKRMNTQQLQLSKADSVTTHLYLYHYPFLKQYPYTNASIIEIERTTKKFY